MRVVHVLEEGFNSINYIFKPIAKKYYPISSIQLLGGLIDYAIENPFKEFHYSELLEKKLIVNSARYLIHDESFEFVDFNVADIFKNIMRGSSYFKVDYRGCIQAPNENYFSVFIDDVYDINNINATRLATAMFFMPNDIIDYIIVEMQKSFVCASSSIGFRVSNCWSINGNSLIEQDSLFAKINQEWGVGAPTIKDINGVDMYTLKLVSSKSVTRTTTEKIEIISRLQQEVFNNYPKKTKQLQKLAKKYLKGKVL